jgi:hypothetical protein
METQKQVCATIFSGQVRRSNFPFPPTSDKKTPKDRERSENPQIKKIIKLTAERELKKETPAREPSRDKREPSKDQREPTPREKSGKEVKVKEEKRDRETKERDDTDGIRKRDKDKERRREKRATSPPADTFEGDLSSVSNSSNGSMQPTADLVIVDDQRGEEVELIEGKKN